MDIQDDTTPSGGHQSHGVYICHRCGWPFPNPHPNPKHRRAHKKICGTIEGYTKLVDSGVFSDDEYESDEDDKLKPPNAVTAFSDSGISPGVKEQFIGLDNKALDGESLQAFKVAQNAGTTILLDSPIEVRKADENIEIFSTPNTNTKDAYKTEENDMAKAEIKLPEFDDRDGSHKDQFIDPEPSATAQTKPDPAKTEDNSSSHAGTFEVRDNEVYVLSIPSDIPLVDHSETLIDDFKDRETVYANVPVTLDTESVSIVDSIEVKTMEEKIQESQTSAVGSTVIKEYESGVEDEQKIVESGGADSRDRSEKLIKEEANTAVDEGCGVDASVGSSSRNSVEGNWGSVSVLSTASVDAENAHSMDKSRLGKSNVFKDSPLVEPKEEMVDQKVSELKPKSEASIAGWTPSSAAHVSNESEGRKRNEEAIAKVTNWSTGKNTTNQAKSPNPRQLSTVIQKDEVVEKSNEPGKSSLTSERPRANQELSPPKYIDEGKKVRKKAKGKASWVPFACCSSVNVN